MYDVYRTYCTNETNKYFENVIVLVYTLYINLQLENYIKYIMYDLGIVTKS